MNKAGNLRKISEKFQKLREDRFMKKKWLRPTALLLAAALMGLTACGGSGNSAGSSAQADGSAAQTEGSGSAKDVLNIRIPDAFSTLDPQGWSLDSDFRLCYQIYEPLYRVDDQTNEIPVLAESYTVSDDGLSYVFKLRSDVNFANGEKMTASDVKFSIERAKNSAYLQSNVTTVDTVDADDANNTVTVHLTEPTPGLIEGLSYVLIVNQKFVEENQDENGSLGFNACGTGPYMLKEYTPDVSVTMEANPNYRGEAPAIKNLKFFLIADENTAMTAFQAGELDIARFANASNWDSLKADPNYQTTELTTNHVTYMIMNTKKAPFDDPLVREAISYAVNRDDIIAMTLNGLGTPAYTLATSMMIGYPETEPAYTYDPEKAKQLLAEAGYPDGLDIGEIQTLSGTYFEDVAVVMQQQLAAVGITSSISALEANALISNAMGGNIGMAAMGQSNTYDMSWLSTYYGTENIGSMNMAQYSDPQVDEMLKEANTEMDAEKRISLYKDILDKVDKEAVYIPLFNKTQCVAWAGNLNYTPSVRMENYASCSFK